MPAGVIEPRHRPIPRQLRQPVVLGEPETHLPGGRPVAVEVAANARQRPELPVASGVAGEQPPCARQGGRKVVPGVQRRKFNPRVGCWTIGDYGTLAGYEPPRGVNPRVPKFYPPSSTTGRLPDTLRPLW